jgi:hypothetical protein
MRTRFSRTTSPSAPGEGTRFIPFSSTYRNLVFAALLPLLMQAGAAAQTVTAVGSIATSIQDLSYDGTLYDVSFGTNIDDTFFGNMPDAYNVGLAIDAVLSADGITAIDEAYPEDPASATFFVDFSSTSAMAGFDDEGDWIGIGQYFSSSTDITDYTADFTALPSSAPEPDTFASVLCGGLLLVLAERIRGARHARQAFRTR